MSERDHYPPGVLCWVDTAQPEPEKAFDFYGAVLGWDFIGSGSMPADGSSDRRRGADLCRSSNRAALTAASEVPQPQQRDTHGPDRQSAPSPR
jgi:hypothetical protein